jgi:hypothetical protein
MPERRDEAWNDRRRGPSRPEDDRRRTQHAAGGQAGAIEHTTAGGASLAELADQHKCQPSAILRLTAEHSPGDVYPGNIAAYINGVFNGTIAATDHMPAGLHLYLPQ